VQPDVIETYRNSIIQHGKYNDRIYVMKVAPGDAPSLPQALTDLANQRGYSKIFAKVPAGQAQPFFDNGFQCEAKVPQFFNGHESALILSCFLDQKREKPVTPERNEDVMTACRNKQAKATNLPLPEGANLRICTPEEIEDMAELYRQVLPTYPFPIDDPNYICETMASHVVYFGIWQEAKLVALSSAEMDGSACNVEMTDFATLPRYQGHGLATILLNTMEGEMRCREMATAYTIARAQSFGMNVTFARMGYDFGGRLINNTNIGGQFEDMNVWYKHLSKMTPQRDGSPKRRAGVQDGRGC